MSSKSKSAFLLSMDRLFVVANPAHGQLIRENAEYGAYSRALFPFSAINIDNTVHLHRQ